MVLSALPPGPTLLYRAPGLARLHSGLASPTTLPVPALNVLSTRPKAACLTLLPCLSLVCPHCVHVHTHRQVWHAHTPTRVTSTFLAQVCSCYLCTGLPGSAYLTSAQQQALGRSPPARRTPNQLARYPPLPITPSLAGFFLPRGPLKTGSCLSIFASHTGDRSAKGHWQT